MKIQERTKERTSLTLDIENWKDDLRRRKEIRGCSCLYHEFSNREIVETSVLQCEKDLDLSRRVYATVTGEGEV